MLFLGGDWRLFCWTDILIITNVTVRSQVCQSDFSINITSNGINFLPVSQLQLWKLDKMWTTVRCEDNGPPLLAHSPYLQLEQQMIPLGPRPIFSSFGALLFLWRFSLASWWRWSWRKSNVIIIISSTHFTFQLYPSQSA